MVLIVTLLVASSFMLESSAEIYYPADCSDSPPKTIPGGPTPETPIVDMLLGNWKVVKQDKENEELNCLTISLKMTENDTEMQATISAFNVSSQQEFSLSAKGTLHTNNTVFMLGVTKDKYYLNTLDLVNFYGIIFTCHGNKAVQYVATKEKPIPVAVEGQDLKDVNHDTCSSASTFAQQTLITIFIVFSLKHLI